MNPRRRTPVLALLVAPVVLWGLMVLWESALVPLYFAVWHSEAVLRVRLRSDTPGIRAEALRDAAAARSLDGALIGEITTLMQTDADANVRHSAARSLGHIGHRQPLPDAARHALEDLLLSDPTDPLLEATLEAVGQSAAHNAYPEQIVTAITGVLDTERSNSVRTSAVRTLAQLAEHQSVPPAALDRLGEAMQQETNAYLRVEAIRALGHAGHAYPPAKSLLMAATQDPHEEVRSAAEVGLRVIAHNEEFAGRTPLEMALDPTQPTASRLTALRIVGSSRIEPHNYASILSLVADGDPDIAVAALGLCHFMARSPGEAFDQQSLIPALDEAMSHGNPRIREAAHGAVSRISIHRPGYPAAAGLRARLAAGVDDPDARVRVVAMAALMRGNPGRAEQEAILERGLSDADPYVRRHVVDWLRSPKTKTSQRQAYFDRALEDPDAGVRTVAAAAQEEWETRKRPWPIALWQRWQAGEHGQVGLTILTAVTMAAPILIGGLFLLYYMARLLTYVYQRRWRAVALVPVIGVWAAASYGMFWLYFAAGHAGNLDGWEILVLAAVLWGAIAVYAALGWGLHYAVRR